MSAEAWVEGTYLHINMQLDCQNSQSALWLLWELSISPKHQGILSALYTPPQCMTRRNSFKLLQEFFGVCLDGKRNDTI